MKVTIAIPLLLLGIFSFFPAKAQNWQGDWDSVSPAIKLLYAKDSLFKNDAFKNAYKLGAVLLDGHNCEPNRLRMRGAYQDDAWPNEYLWRFLRGGTRREIYWASAIILDSTNIEKGIGLSDNSDYLKERKKLIRHVIDNVLVNRTYDNICSTEYDNSRHELMSKLIYTFMYSRVNNLLGGPSFLSQDMSKLKALYEDSMKNAGEKEVYITEEMRKWPYLYNH